MRNTVTDKGCTGWFSGDVHPAYPGVYQVDFGSAVGMYLYRYYDGKNWFSGSTISPRYAYWYMYKTKHRMLAASPKQWRGLKEKHKGA
jgi:hypothetical protein